MKSLKTMIGRYMRLIAAGIVIGVLIITFFVDVLAEQRHARQLADRMFYQMEHILKENEEDLYQVVQEYAQECLSHADEIAYLIQLNPEIIYDEAELKKIAKLVDVDEVHLFDENGKIFSGTHSQYTDYTFDSGEQMAYFKPMLEDKTLRMCQEITPNTAEGKQMQYSAVWSEDGTFIVQVGMEPQKVIDATKKNDLSHIFSLLKVNVDASFYAIDIETGEIEASTNTWDEEKMASEIGISMADLKNKQESFHAKVNGVNSYCVFTTMGDKYIGRVISNETLYENIPQEMLELAACLILIAVILVVSVTRYMNRQVVSGIYHVNEKLRKITKGELNEWVDVANSVEFYELSNHINEMVLKLLDNNKQLTQLLGKVKQERDLDTLTGLYNRRGLDNQLEQLFLKPEKLGYCAMVMIDSDGLKEINDRYGHEKGDIYLQKIAGVLNHFGLKSSIAARQGGDEFVLFLYEYDDLEELQNTIHTLKYIQNHSSASLDDKLSVPLSFSFGYEIQEKPLNYKEMIKCADEKMYENKRERKAN